MRVHFEHAALRLRGRALDLAIDRCAARGGRFHDTIDILLGEARSSGYARPVARERGGNVFIGGARCRTLGVELRIALVGERERTFERANAGTTPNDEPALARRLRRRGKRDGYRCGERNDRRPRPHSPPATRITRHMPAPRDQRAALSAAAPTVIGQNKPKLRRRRRRKPWGNGTFSKKL